ncbi:hypothetical protein M409DRAFT_28809 [Zasmidium cellare ATCC 36951]|uniref:Major facilitator superfamily (MFS) profile domain-containing protein n=1 Tax=Zasmidium cellare ATCC 36951 TaxID=1080233 RepID=A0A6A6C4J5_ZASCE|nr:uncharacterized protein M409DRAFT_28809 [Zasmidium cellare ATCC 36951]KAF2160669.1 hypothetical protein M409DRAFT_28809 [Zasmidium cellare ATCC 36951]
MDNPPSSAIILDPKTEKRILRKLDLTLIPMLWLLMIISFADRSGIANAKIQGMDVDLDLTGNKYNMAVMVFTIAYMIFGIPANIVFRILGPKSLAGMMVFWGVCAGAQGLVKNYAGLVAFRFLMGVFEAGFVPGSAYLIGSYYKKDEFLKRYAFFFSGAIIAGAFNGLLSFALAKADGAGGLAGWRWIFIVEGLITVVMAGLAYVLLPNFPESTTLFHGHEKAILLERLRLDGGLISNDDNLRPNVLAALLDWKIWLATLVYMCAQENVSSIAAFLPSILKGLGYTSVSAQIHSIPVYCTAFALTLLCAYTSERLHQRYIFALLGALLNLTGLVLQLAYPHAVHVRYMGTFFMTSGCYIVMPIMVVWNAINVGKGYKRVVAFAMTTAVGNCGALVSSNVYITEEAPGYRTGFSVGVGMSCLAILAMMGLYIGLRVGNWRGERKILNEGSEVSGHGEENGVGVRYQL